MQFVSLKWHSFPLSGSFSRMLFFLILASTPISYFIPFFPLVRCFACKIEFALWRWMRGRFLNGLKCAFSHSTLPTPARRMLWVNQALSVGVWARDGSCQDISAIGGTSNEEFFGSLSKLDPATLGGFHSVPFVKNSSEQRKKRIKKVFVETKTEESQSKFIPRKQFHYLRLPRA